MSLTFEDLDRLLQNEQKKCDNHLVIGGLEKYLETWARQQVPSSKDRVNAILKTLAGYSDATPQARRAMIERVLPIVHEDPRASQIVELSQAQPLRETPVKKPRRPAAKPDSTARQQVAKPPDKCEQTVDEPAEAMAEPDEEERARYQIRGNVNYGLDAAVTRLQNVGPAFAKKLGKLGIYTIGDLLYHFPHRYDDYSKLKSISELMYGEEVTLLLTVCEAKTRSTQRGMTVTTVLLADPTGTIQATYFNQPYLAQQFAPGRRIVVSGRVDRDLSRLAFKHPEWEPFTKSLLHTARVVPVYPLTEGLTNRRLRRVIYSVVDYWAPRVPDPLPPDLRQSKNLLDLTTSLKEIHFPSALEKMSAARRRLAFEEFLYIQIGVLRQRLKWRDTPGKPLKVDRHDIDSFKAMLPFKLTGAQERTCEEILADIEKSQPMSRLLQGDVGSGKTVVAAASMLVAATNGAQSAVMAPTEILAEQHYKTLSGLFGENLRIRLLTGSLKSKDKEQVRAEIAAGEVDIAVGTHALIQESVQFRELGLAIIDEQHRFGVEQRGMIRAKGYNPHILVMSATPIPRTLALTIYGDLDISVIDEMPPGRQAIKTKWLEPLARERAYGQIRKHVQQGRQAFVICPLIEESESIDAKAAVEEYEGLRTNVFADLRVGLIHGKLKAAEKEAVMNAFRDHEIDILVATSVVEVGIDVPNATVMLIEGADRFGLAQLHQFRGRVGRGEYESICMLLAEKKESVSDERLRVIESSQDGFRLAEEDLKLRGPGEFFGTRQSGLPDLKVAKLSDVKYLEEARSVAEDIFSRDPDLRLPEHQLMAVKVREFWKGKGDLS